MTLHLNGIPKSTCTPQDIINLFSSVAQIKRVEINQEHGRARVELYDKTSTSFVVSKKWTINGAELHVAESDHASEERKNKKPNNETKIQVAKVLKARTTTCTEMPYQIYKSNANIFWTDIPHQKARIRTKKMKTKTKFYRGIPPKNQTEYMTEYMMGRFQKAKPIQKRNSKKKKTNRKDFSDHFNSLTLDKFIEYVDTVIKEICMSKRKMDT